MSYDNSLPRYTGGRADPESDRTIRLPIGIDADDDTADRLGVHFVLEALLAVGFAGALFAFYRLEGSPLTGASGRDHVIAAIVPLLLVATATAISLRVSAPNLATGAIALTTGVLFAENSSRGVAPALLIALGAALGVGVVLTVLTIVLRTPGWLVSGAVAAAVLLWIAEHVNMSAAAIEPIGRLSTSDAWIWLIGAAALSVLGGTVGALRGWRERLGECRDAAVPPARRTRATVMTTAWVLLSSSALAGAAGVWLMWLTADVSVVGRQLDPLLLTGFGVAAALLGGCSAFGRRGGILGTVLATGLLAVTLLHSEEAGWRLSPLWILLIATGVGFVATALVERLGRPKADGAEAEADPREEIGGLEPADRTILRPPRDHGDIDPYQGGGVQDEFGRR
ncbi:MAG: hypothetical protein ACRDXX_18400 [Stackebrandtia sp.]